MIIILCSLLVVSVFQRLKCANSLIVKMREEPDRKQKENVDLKLLRMAIFGNKILHQMENHS